MARLISRAELSRLAGVSDVAISKACRASLAPACDGKRVDLDHPAVRDYLARKGRAPTPPPERPKKPRRSRTVVRPTPAQAEPADPAPMVPGGVSAEQAESDLRDLANGLGVEDVDGFPQMTLQALIERFGTASRIKDWLDARKKISDILEKDLKNDETTDRLIARELVKTHVFGAIEAANKRLLQDAPKNIARRIYTMAAAKVPVEEAEKAVREIVGSQLNPVKQQVARVLRDA